MGDGETGAPAVMTPATSEPGLHRHTGPGTGGPPELPRRRFGVPQRADRVADNRRLNGPAESAARNVRVPSETEASDRPVKPEGRRSRHSSPRPGEPATRRRAAVCREAEAEVAECQRGGSVAMNVGEMQRLLSLKAEREPGHKFGDLHGLVCDMDWLWLAHDY